MDAIFLIAGNSLRFGSNKLLYEISGKPMYVHVLEHLCQLWEDKKLEHIIVVTQYYQMEEDISRRYPQIYIVRNEHPNWGISHSIFLGLMELKRIAPKSDACLFSVGDQPYVKKSSIEGLVRTWWESQKGIAVCAYGEESGNPVIFSHQYYELLSKMTGDKGGKRIVMEHLEDTVFYQVSKKELEDIDVQSVLHAGE